MSTFKLWNDRQCLQVCWVWRKTSQWVVTGRFFKDSTLPLASMETWFYLFSELSRTYHHFHQIFNKKVDGDCNLWSVAKDRGHHRSKVQNIFSTFFLTLLNSDMRLQWLWLHLTGNLFDNIMTWGSSWCIFLAPSWMCGSSSTASLVLCSQELRNVIGSYLAQSSGGDVKECSLLRTNKNS